MKNKIDFFRLGLFTLVLILIYALHQRFDIPALVSFFMFGSVVIFAFMLGLEKDSLEKGEMTVAEIKREQRKMLIFRTSLILSMLGSITLVTVKA